MTVLEFFNEKEVLNILIDAVDEIEVHTKKIGHKKLEKPLGFFFARVLDNRFTQSKMRKELIIAINRAGAFVIVTQILIYIILSKDNDKKNFDRVLFQSNRQIQSIFDDISNKENYKAIFDTRIVELLPVESIVTLNKVFQSLLLFQKQEFSTDILGKIFHSLIPFELRKFLAAYYTSNVVGEFLSYMVIKNAQIKIMDPACGSGTLLVSAYKRIKELNNKLDHNQILQNIYGVDVSSFAAQLAAINLAIQKPTDTLGNFEIAIIDFFNLRIRELTEENEGSGFDVPKLDVILGNPPFTRGDRLDSSYKDFLERRLHEHGYIFNYSKKYLGLYAYFLIDSLRFLKKGGTLAFILPLSTINSSTNKPVLKFLLSEFAFKYIITSETNVTFSEQCTFKEILLIAQKGRDKKSRTKFVVLKKELTRENYRALGKRIEETTEDFEDASIRIHHISRLVLDKTVEMNWTVYFFDKVFYQLFEQIRNLETITPINQLVQTPRYDVDRGLRAGISDFFYLPNKYWKIVDDTKNWIKIENISQAIILKLKRQYISKVLRKSSLYELITPKIKDYIVVIPDHGALESDIEEYIRWGVQKFRKTGFENLSYKHIAKNRKIARVGITHKLSLTSNSIITYYSPDPIVLTDNFIFIRTNNEENDKILAAYLNSSLFILTYFVLRREKTGALGQIFGTDVRNFFCLDPRKVSKTDREELLQIFDRFIIKSKGFPPFYDQIVEVMKNKNHIRFLLDRKICEILKLENILNFLKQLYGTLSIEFNKFNG